MDDSFKHELTPQDILTIFENSKDIINQNQSHLSDTERQQKLSSLFKALTELNNYFLIDPQNLNNDFKEPLIKIFQNPPSKEIMNICSKCIVTALKSEVSTVIQPTDFSFPDIIMHIKTGNYSDQTIINLLEIIFAISDQQSSKLVNQKNDDIDIFFKFYDKFDPPSRVSCLKCINNIVSDQVLPRHVIFLPNLLDIAQKSDTNTSQYQFSIQAFLTISRSLNKETIVPQENFQPTEYCEKLCCFTSTYTDLDTLSVFIDSIRACIVSFKTMVNIVLKYIKLTSFFEGIEKVPILEAAIRLTLVLMPKPSNDIIELFPEKEFKWTDSYSISSDAQIKAVIPFIFYLYCNNLSLSKLCIQALTIFVYSKSFQFPLSNQIIYMMHINLIDDTFVPYILAIVNRCMKTNTNLEAILRTKLIERITEKPANNGGYTEKVISEILHFSTNSPYANSWIQFGTIDELLLLIEQGQISPYDLFASYVRITPNTINYVKIIKKIIEKLPDIHSIYEKCQSLVNFLIQMISEIPIPMTCTDPYYPDYNKLNDEEIEIQPNDNNFDTKTISFYSIISELTENINARASDIENLVNNKPELAAVFDKSTLNHINKYTYNVLYREFSEKEKKSVSINDVTINDTDQFVISILPQILNSVVDDPLNPVQMSSDLMQLIKQKFKMKNVKKTRFSKLNNLTFKMNFLKGGEVVHEILEILKLVYEKDQRRKIKFLYEPFIERFEPQKKFFFLLITLYSPYAQLMVKYPFLFKMEDRLFLFKLLTLEPLLARDFFTKTMNPQIATKKQDPFSKIKCIVDRNDLFKQGITVLEHFAKYPSFLEVSFSGDVGYGTGTTSQFFDKMSSEFCMKKHRMWRRDNVRDKSAIYAVNNQGLFPYATANSRYMRALGLFVAKAIQNEEVIDIPFNPSFFDLAAGRQITLYDVDEQYAQSLYDEGTEQLAIDDEWKFVIDIDSREEPFEIIKNGKNITVTHENFEGFIKSMENYVCGKHVKKKIDHFVDGFAEVLDPLFLQMFTGEEVIKILNGKREKLTIESISKFIKADIGYEEDSDQIKNLKEIIADFDFEQQKYFIKYVTGLSCLPYGGLEMLDPPITVSRREAHDKHYKDEDCWPSARTCIHKLFLPPYKTKEQMKENMIMAITDPAFRESFGIS